MDDVKKKKFKFLPKNGFQVPENSFKFVLKFVEWGLANYQENFNSMVVENINPKSVPYIQLFGITENDESVSCSVHNFLPYLYIPYIGPKELSESKNYLEELQKALNEYPPLFIHGGLIASTEIVEKLPFYGFHKDTEIFVKVKIFHKKYFHFTNQ